MAITISGENNNDRILASDGVIDQLSGFNVVGVMTATSFTGDLTGDVTGNLTGNVTGNINNSTLLLQTGGSERIRITGNNEIGIAGANYGSSGQVLTSGGSGSAVSWTTPTPPAITSIANDGAERVLTSDGDGTATAHSFVTIENNRLSVNRGTGSGAFPLIVRRTDASGIIAEFANSSGYGLLIGQNSATGEAYLRTGTGQPLVFTTNAGSGIANERVRITEAGKVGIGTDNPKQWVSMNSGRVSIDIRADYYGAWIDGDSSGTSSFNVGRWHNAGGRMRSGGSHDNDLVVETQNTSHNLQLQPSGGKVGINNASPDNKLSIYDVGYCGLELKSNRSTATDNIGGVHWKTQSTNVAYIQSLVDGSIKFRNTSSLTERLRIASDGKLMTQASGYIYTSSSAGSLTLYGGNTNKGGGIILSGGNSPSTGDIRFYAQMSQSSPAERLRIASDGEIFMGDGFGSANRSTILSICGAHQSPSGVMAHVGIYANDSQAADKGGSISFGGQDGSTPKQTFSAILGAKENGTSGNYAGYMAFYTRPAGAVSGERMRITSDGHVLFSGLSEVHDTRNAKGITIKSSSGGGGISIQNFGSNGSKNWRIRPDDGTAWGALDFSVGDDANSNTSWPSGAGDVVLSLRGNRDVHVDNGNLVIGTSGKGISFAATSDGGTVGSELLDDYEEGTWTPTANYGASGIVVYASRYTKIGNKVFIDFRGYLTGTNGNSVQIGGLPYANLASNAHNVGPVMHNGFDYSGSTEPVAVSYITGTNSYFQMYYSQTNSNGWSSVTGSQTNGQQFITSLTYFTSS